MNKKGQTMALFVMVAIVLIIIVSALLIGLGSGVATYLSSTITDITSDLGVIETGGEEGSNLSYYSDLTVGTVNSVVQMAKWGSGVAIIFSLLAILIIASVVRLHPNAFLIGFYIILVIVMVVTAMFVSNMYEDFHGGTDEIAVELQSMPLTSFLIIYLPQIITVIGFLGGIIAFSGVGEEFG